MYNMCVSYFLSSQQTTSDLILKGRAVELLDGQRGLESKGRPQVTVKA